MEFHEYGLDMGAPGTDRSMVTYMHLQPDGTVLALDVTELTPEKLSYLRGELGTVEGVRVVDGPGLEARKQAAAQPQDPKTHMQQLRRQVLGSKKGRW